MEAETNDTATFDLLSNASGPSNGTRSRDEELAKVEMAILSCIFIVTLMGNFIVIMGIYFRRQKMTRMYYFILHLSLADLITAFFNVGTQFGMELTFPDFLGNNALCKFVKFTQILGPYSSSYVLVMTALDRYQAICHPMSNCTWTAKRSKVMLGLAWAISFICCLPQLFIFSLQMVPGYGNYDCWGSFPPGGQEVYVTWYSISIFIIPLLILIFAYTCICRTIWLNLSMKTAARKEEYSLPKANGTFGNGTEGHIINLNRLNSGAVEAKPVEVSWRIDLKGKVNSAVGRGRWKRDSESYSPSSSPEQEVSCEQNSPGHDVEIVPNGHGVKYTAKSKLRYKWPKAKGPKGGPGDAKSNGSSKSLLTVPPKVKGVKLTRASNYNQPRSSSVKGISRAKIKTVKLTVTVICCYIFCSSPFIAAQLWVTFDPDAVHSPFYTGTTFTILTLLASLNSCVNPWIFLFFNPNLLQDFLRGFGGGRRLGHNRASRASGGSPVTQRTSPGLLRSGNSVRNSHLVNVSGSRKLISASNDGSLLAQGRRLHSGTGGTNGSAGLVQHLQNV